jgi:hypothetical protein
MLGICNTERRIVAFLRSALQKEQEGLNEWDDDDSE